MKIPFLKYTFIFSLLIAGSSVLAQDKKDDSKQNPPKGTITEEIEVVRPYKPVLADAVKIRRNPDLNNNAPFKPILTYRILDKKLELNSNIKELQAQKLIDEQQAVLKNNYVKIGAGNFNTGLAELYLNSGQDEALQAGLFIKHLSQHGSINKQQLSNQQIGIFAKSVGDQLTLSGKVSYDRKSSFFYGFNPALAPPSVDPDKLQSNLFEAQGELMNNTSSQDESPFNFATKLNAYLFNTALNGRENSVILSGYFNKAADNFHFGTNTSVDFTATKEPSYSISNNILRVNPYVKYQGSGFSLNLGLNLVQEFGDNQRLNILPAVSAEIPIAAEYATLFAGLNGDVIKTSLKDLSSENQYLNNNILIKNSVEKMNIYGGIKGNAGSVFGFKAMAYYKTVDDLPLFVNNPSNVSRFDVIYDNGKSNITGFEGEIDIKASDVLSLTGKAQTISYKLATEKEAWFKPAIRLISNARGQINKKFSLDTEVIFNGESKAKTFNLQQQQQIVTVKSYVDFSAGAEYKFNEKLGLYLRVNNILGDKYQHYLYYPKLGLNVLGGFNFSF